MAFWNIKKADKSNHTKEINRILNEYGFAKGAAILTYYYSFTVEARKLLSVGRSSSELMPTLTMSILKNHNKDFFAEYGSFFTKNYKNKALMQELERSGTKFYDETIFAGFFSGADQQNNTGSTNPIRTNDPIEFLNLKAKELMRKENLLNADGSMPIISELYYPDVFAEKAMKYCSEHFEDDGEQKKRSEYIITSFYAAICSTILFKKKELIPNDEDYLFYQLMRFVDMECVDLAAEHLLGTENGQPFAEEIWGVISPYVGICINVFKSVSLLSEDIVLAAIKNSFTIGMLVGHKYSSGKYSNVLDLFVNEDFYKIDDPGDINFSYCPGAVCISGVLGIWGHLVLLVDNIYGRGNATIKLLPIDEAEREIMSRIEECEDHDLRTVSVYGKLINKGNMDCELQYAFIDYKPEYVRQLKRLI